MDIKLFAQFLSNISRQIFLWCFLLLACDGSGGKEPFKNFLYVLVTSKKFFIGKLYREALEVYFSNATFHIGNGEGKTSLAWFDKFKIGQCMLHPEGTHFDELRGPKYPTTCYNHRYIPYIEAYMKPRHTSFRKLHELRTLTIECLNGYAPLVVPLINIASQNSPFLKRVVINFAHGGKAPRALPRSRDYGKNLIATINANFGDTKGVRKSTTEKQRRIWGWDNWEKYRKTWVWEAKAGPGNSLQLVQKDMLIWREKYFIMNQRILGLGWHYLS